MSGKKKVSKPKKEKLIDFLKDFKKINKKPIEVKKPRGK